MHDLGQHGGKNASHLLWRHDALILLVAVLWLMTAPAGLHAQSSMDTLPDAPSALLFPASIAAQQNALLDETQDAAPNAPQTTPQNVRQQAPQTVAPAPAHQSESATVLPCPKREHPRAVPIVFLPATQPTCQDQLQLIIDTGYEKSLTSAQKGILAIRAVIDPFNLLTIAAFSGISIAANSHSVYGPGFAGWGRLSGYSFAEDSQADFTGVYLIPSLVHEDPRYHRMPTASVSRRIEHALIHTVVSQHDDGSLMPNYATLINVPLSAEISNLYVPGLATNASSTAKRVVVGYATDPIGPLLAEFLPDFAERVHVHIVFAQQILNRLALGSGAPSSSY